MEYRIEKPTTDKAQLERLFNFILSTGKIYQLSEPQLFMDGWHNGQIRIFSAYEQGNIVGISVVLLVKDPIQVGKYHIVRSLDVGVRLDAFIEDKLGVFL
ncbi:hypothetical protein HPC38_01400 [Pasteurellaceae bacterium HPA106]|uniref:hypothetical protein n=1 Tax=Spirabiliibacterium pneumoniae TaxID=221400 RepID=UPI001AAD4866|nr:hypothetical protein [Spirabiliibacterium pneumoniae]MBE2895533.1 hypothetical protein [Spirabiliibacterium pneumoniae]